MKLKSGRLQFYNKQGNWIGPTEMKEPTYYETLRVVNGVVETDHPITIQWLITRGYIIINGKKEEEQERESIQEQFSAAQEGEKEEVIGEIVVEKAKRDWSQWKNSPGRPRKS